MSFLRRLPRPAAFELVAYSALALVMLFLQAQGMRQGWRITYMAKLLPLAVAKVLLLGIALQVVYRIVVVRDLRTYLRDLVRPASLLLVVRAWAASVAIWYLYPWLKVALPLLRPHTFDSLLWDLDILIHAGLSPSWFVTGLFGSPAALRAIDTWYAVWIHSAMAGTGFFAVALCHRQRRQFLLSHVLLWVLGASCYFAVPATGPCYTHPEVWQGLEDGLPRARGLQRDLWLNSRALLRHAEGQRSQVNPFYGIAAMPSLHVGVHFLITLWAFTERRWLGLACAAATLVTFLGSIATGWHYAVDGYVGALLAAACFGLARLTERGPPRAVASDEPDEDPWESVRS